VATLRNLRAVLHDARSAALCVCTLLIGAAVPASGQTPTLETTAPIELWRGVRLVDTFPGSSLTPGDSATNQVRISDTVAPSPATPASSVDAALVAHPAPQPPIPGFGPQTEVPASPAASRLIPLGLSSPSTSSQSDAPPTVGGSRVAEVPASRDVLAAGASAASQHNTWRYAIMNIAVVLLAPLFLLAAYTWTRRRSKKRFKRFVRAQNVVGKTLSLKNSDVVAARIEIEPRLVKSTLRKQQPNQTAAAVTR
jgi:hypothetical protein